MQTTHQTLRATAQRAPLRHRTASRPRPAAPTHMGSVHLFSNAHCDHEPGSLRGLLPLLLLVRHSFSDGGWRTGLARGGPVPYARPQVHGKTLTWPILTNFDQF